LAARFVGRFWAMTGAKENSEKARESKKVLNLRENKNSPLENGITFRNRTALDVPATDFGWK
jgi:hypothetical protein